MMPLCTESGLVYMLTIEFSLEEVEVGLDSNVVGLIEL
jgi:hypothetical protein